MLDLNASHLSPLSEEIFMKFWDGNVFTSVCHSFCPRRRVGGLPRERLHLGDLHLGGGLCPGDLHPGVVGPGGSASRGVCLGWSASKGEGGLPGGSASTWGMYPEGESASGTGLHPGGGGWTDHPNRILQIMGNLWVVYILLECILVNTNFICLPSLADSSGTVESAGVQIPGTMTIDGTFGEDLQDPTSPRYQEIERSTCEEVQLNWD